MALCFEVTNNRGPLSARFSMTVDTCLDRALMTPACTTDSPDDYPPPTPPRGRTWAPVVVDSRHGAEAESA
jgi:hypothetical protein